MLRWFDTIPSYDLLHMPDRLYKYYRYDDALNAKRLSGQVYLASPLDFNDPCDCQRKVINNAQARCEQKGIDWLYGKLLELGYNREQVDDVADKLLKDDEDVLYEVYKRQLERAGVLCLAGTATDTLMWGYYASNEGYCLEYDTQQIVERLVLGYVNKLDYVITDKYLNVDRYRLSPIERDKETPSDKRRYVARFDASAVSLVTNRYLLDHADSVEVAHFLQNVFIKRFAGGNIDYQVSVDGLPSTLFFDKTNEASKTKYYKKTTVWEHEREFRVVVSLGGRMAINLGADCIRNIYLGCNMSTEKVLEVANLLNCCGVHAGLYKMRRMVSCALQAEPIPDILTRPMTYTAAHEYLQKQCHLRW